MNNEHDTGIMARRHKRAGSISIPKSDILYDSSLIENPPEVKAPSVIEDPDVKSLGKYERFDNSDMEDMNRMVLVNEFLQQINPSMVCYPPITKNGFTYYPLSRLATQNQDEIMSNVGKLPSYGGLGRNWKYIRAPRIAIPDESSDEEGSRRLVEDWPTLERTALVINTPIIKAPFELLSEKMYHMIALLTIIAIVYLLFPVESELDMNNLFFSK